MRLRLVCHVSGYGNCAQPEKKYAQNNILRLARVAAHEIGHSERHVLVVPNQALEGRDVATLCLRNQFSIIQRPILQNLSHSHYSCRGDVVPNSLSPIRYTATMCKASRREGCSRRFGILEGTSVQRISPVFQYGPCFVVDDDGHHVVRIGGAVAIWPGDEVVVKPFPCCRDFPDVGHPQRI